jgi:hypothetical protein
MRGDLARLHIPQFDLLLLRRNLKGLAVGAHTDGELLAEQLLACYQQARFLLNHVTDAVRQAAVRVRYLRPLLHHQDFSVFIQSTQARRTRRPASDSADNDDFHDGILDLRVIFHRTSNNTNVGCELALT